MPVQPIESASALATLAQEFTSTVAATANFRHARLPEGLELVMQRTPDGCLRRRWRLALAGETRYPSQEEVDSCRLAFNVPVGAVERRLERCRTHPKSQRRIRYHIVEWTWTETFGL